MQDPELFPLEREILQSIRMSLQANVRSSLTSVLPVGRVPLSSSSSDSSPDPPCCPWLELRLNGEETGCGCERAALGFNAAINS